VIYSDGRHCACCFLISQPLRIYRISSHIASRTRHTHAAKC